MEENPMQRLHSYWRMEYIKVPRPEKEKENPFINIPNAKNDKDVHIIYRSQYTYIVLNTFPYNPGHLLVVPFREVKNLHELNEEERLDLMNMIVKSQDILSKSISPHGFNVGFNLGSAAGAGIPQHLHCHIVPRWDGDTNFMPVIGNTKVLPQSLDAMWNSLHAVL